MGRAAAEMMPMQRAVVTGGGGFVGRAIVERLLAEGVATTVVGRHHYPQLAKLGATCVVGSICDQAVMDRAVAQAEVVFHVAALAGIWGPWQDYHQTNVVGTETVLAACQRNRVPILVYTSTPSVVFDRQDICGGDERLGYATRFLCHYAKTKAMAEQKVLAANCRLLRTCALRPHLIWGPGDPHLLPRLLESGRKRALKRVGDGSNLVDISYVDNVAHAHLLAAKNLAGVGSAAGRAYFISQGEPVRLWNWINELFAAMDVAPVDRSVSFAFAYRLGAVLETVYRATGRAQEPRMTRFLAEQLAKSHYFSIDHARRDLGYEPIVSTSEGLRRTIAWLKEH